MGSVALPPEPGRIPAELSGYGIAAVERMADLVATMMRLGPASLTELSQQSGCTRPNTFRILHTLRARGLAMQLGRRGHWQLGAAWLSVARAAIHHGVIQAVAQPVLNTLAERVSEPVYLSRRDGEQSVVAAIHAGGAAIRMVAALGDRAPLHAGPGRLLLANAPVSVQRAVLAGRLPRLGAATRVDPLRISADFAAIRTRNWLITTDEIADGMVSVSTAVLDANADVAAVLSIISPALRLRPPRPHALLTPLLDAAAVLGGRLYPAPGAPAETDAGAGAVHAALSRQSNK